MQAVAEIRLLADEVCTLDQCLAGEDVRQQKSEPFSVQICMQSMECTVHLASAENFAYGMQHLSITACNVHEQSIIWFVVVAKSTQ